MKTVVDVKTVLKQNQVQRQRPLPKKRISQQTRLFVSVPVKYMESDFQLRGTFNLKD